MVKLNVPVTPPVVSLQISMKPSAWALSARARVVAPGTAPS